MDGGAGIQFDPGGIAVSDDDAGHRRFDVELIAEAVNRLEQLRSGFAIERRVVELDVEREAAFGDVADVLQPLDDIDFPQRLGAVQWTRMDAGDLDHQLSPVAGGGQGNMADVVLDIDFAIFQPVGTVDAERRHDQTPTENLDRIGAATEKVENLLEAHGSARRGGLVIDSQPGNMHVLVAMLQLEEEIVHSGEWLHDAGSFRSGSMKADTPVAIVRRRESAVIAL
jgi:hypothetical protein